MDALWELADVIAGPDFSMNPAEAFVFGAAALVHDLAMSRGAIAVIGSDLRRHPRWRDSLAAVLRDEYRRPPTADEIDNAPSQLVAHVEQDLLRSLHAEHAAELPAAAWPQLDGSQGYIIQDSEIRSAYGVLIGRIAASHHWPLDRVRGEFSTPSGAAGFAPSGFSVDSLTVASLLRLTDAAHLDATRVPGILAHARGIKGESRDHWIFQSRLQRPYVQNDRFVFTAASGFSVDEMSAWWLAYETLRMVDGELRGVDNLLAEAGRARFSVRGVAYVDTPESFSGRAPCVEWSPVSANVQVTDVAGLVRRLGGAELYGAGAVSAGIREIVANAFDAVLAARAITLNLPVARDLGAVTVTWEIVDGATWLTVDDTGIGMSRDLLAGALLDFGKSSWLSTEVAAENPGLVSSQFVPSGRFGIGFFAVFMLGEEVRVVSRGRRAAEADTWVLQFDSGVVGRPTVRKARDSECRSAPGTSVSVRLSSDWVGDSGSPRFPVAPHGAGSILTSWDASLADLLAHLFPAPLVDVWIVEPGRDPRRVLASDDWITIPGDELLRRVMGPMAVLGEEVDLPALAERMHVLNDEEGLPVARVALLGAAEIGEMGWAGNQFSVVTAGAARSESCVNGVAGIFLGQPTRAARDSARPLVDRDVLARWASDEGHRVFVSSRSDPTFVRELAGAVCELGGDVSRIPCWHTADGWLDESSFAAWIAERDRVVIAHPIHESVRIGDASIPMELASDVVVFEGGRRLAINEGFWPEVDFAERFFAGGLIGRLVGLVASQWGVDREVIESAFAEKNSEEVVAAHQDSPVRAHVTVLRRKDEAPSGRSR